MNDYDERLAQLERSYTQALRRFRIGLWIALGIFYVGATVFTILTVLPLMLIGTDYFATSSQWVWMPKWAWTWLSLACGSVICVITLFKLGRIQEDVLRREEQERVDARSSAPVSEKI